MLNQSVDSRSNVKKLSSETKALFDALSPKIQKSEENRLHEVKNVVKKGADVNAPSTNTSENKNTPLHIATQNGYKSVVTYLLGYPDIKTDIKNDKGQTTLDLVEKILKNKKLKNRNIYEDIKKNLEHHCDVDFVEKTDDTLRGEMADKFEDMVFCMMERAGRTKFQNSEFKIGREVKTRETSNQKFDDTVFSYKESDKKYIIPVQVKHSTVTKKIDNFDLESTKGDFGIQKYFLSYLDLKLDIKKFTDKKSFNAEDNKEAKKRLYFEDCEIQYVVLFTSANFDTRRLEEANFKFKEDAPLGIIDIFDLSSGGPKKHSYKNYKQLNVISDKLKRSLLQTISDFESQNNNPRSTVSEQENEINNFLNRLVFVINQPNADFLELKLSGLYQQEIFAGTPFNEILGDSFKHYRQNLEKDLFRKGGRPSGWIDGENAVSYFKELENKIRTSIIVASMTIMYDKQTLSYGTFENLHILTGLDRFLDDVNGSVLHLKTLEPLFSSIKLLQYLNTRTDYSLDKSNRISVTLEEVLRSDEHKKAVVNTFKGSATTLLIIECNDRSFSQEKLFDLYNSLLSSLTQLGSKKKIILVNHKERTNALNEHFRFTNVLNYYELNDEIDTQDFKPFKDPLEKKLILLQGEGEKTSLNQLLHPFPRDIIDINVFADLVRGKEINIGSQLTDLGEIKHCYINRKINQLLIDHSKIQIENDRSFQDKLVYTKEHFDCICERNPDANVHWLKSEPGKLIWQKSQGSLSQLRTYVKSKGSCTDYYSESEFVDQCKENKLIIISDTAGMGKTTVLTSLSKKIKEKYSDRWIIRINLIKHTGQLNDLATTGLLNENQAIDFLLSKLLQLEDGLEKKLLDYNLRMGSENAMQIVILVDGFDEIVPEYKKIVIDWLAVLKKTKIERLLVTTRPNMKMDLENKFGVLAYDLKPFSEDSDQLNFLAKFWKQKLKEEKVSQVNYQQLEIYGHELITRFSASTRNLETEFTSIPLHTWMVANIFYENKERNQTKQWQGCKEFLCATKIQNKKPALPSQLNIADLYERFVETIFYDIHFKKKQEIDFTKPRNKKLLEQEYQKFKKQKQELALYTLLNNDDFKKVSSTNQEEINGWIEDIRSGGENEGIINQIMGDKPQFTHATFAEYFAASAFAEKMVADISGTLEIINKMLPHTSRIFINSIIKQIESTKRTEILALLTWPQPDKDGKTPLHYAVQNDHCNIMTYLLSYYNDIPEENILEHGTFKKEEYRTSNLVCFVNQKDIYGKTALYYAIENNRLKIACDLLLKGADSNNLNIKTLVSYVMEKVRAPYAWEDHKLRSIEEKLLLQDPSPASELSLSYAARLLSYFFWNGRLEVIKAILNAIEDPKMKKNLFNAKDRGLTPLDYVNRNGKLSDDDRLKITKYIVDNGGFGSCGCTPICHHSIIRMIS
ncbi:hypothetical protein QYM36_002656 [Artemia franciscana]|uniref:NACHT domain-containing protein n=1 Tax=Artemia franciscana TaxID=6661 RepID=A0AA88LHS8_ARTSF|nr:hypothetical protein QYM36_002656 [Artemia franciscana]